MELTFTISDGRSFVAKAVNTKDRVKVEYKDKSGKRIVRYIIVTKNDKLIMN